MEIKYLMEDKLKRSTDYASAERSMAGLLKGYDLAGSPIALPDFTDSNSLPNGTTVIITDQKPINPALIGMDIGCGYSFFSLQMNPKRFLKKRKLRERALSDVVNSIDYQIRNFNREDKQIGTIGGGNHFIDIFILDEVYDENQCKQFGLDEEKVYFMIHSGSRDFGFQKYKEFSDRFRSLEEDKMKEFNVEYLKSFSEARDYARKNRLLLRQIVEEVISGEFQGNGSFSFYDKPHNEIESIINGSTYHKLMKGTSTLQEGEMFVIPGTATDSAYVIVGEEGLKDSHNTINHGAGRKYSRNQTLSKFRRSDLDEMFKNIVLNVRPNQMVEEVPAAYKNIHEVIASVERFKLARKVAKLRPIGVIVERK